MQNKFVYHSRHDKTNQQANDRDLWDKFWRDHHGSMVVFQMPNVWLIAWLVLEVVSLLVASHRVEIVSWWLATAALAVWALLEIFQGVNYFRRLLGLIVALLTLLSVFGVGL
jgi:hypothetical protein